jgi:5,10-methylene-tetrahydrofolate dehydrogenase/methenyl tetrahydrofolate cyclohydrolase
LFPELNEKDQLLLKNYVNIILEYFREKLDSEFLTTYKYSNANYTRKYLGLNQVKGIIETFPINLETDKKNNFKRIIFKKDMRQLFNFLSTNLNTCQ